MSQLINNYVCVVGSRSLPPIWAGKIKSVVSYLLSRGYGIGSGGAVGADLFALKALVHSHKCSSSVVHLPSVISNTPPSVRPWLQCFAHFGGQVIEGDALASASRSAFISALFARSRALVEGAGGVVAFTCGPSHGSWFTCRHAASLGLKVVVFPVSGTSGLSIIGPGHWAHLSGLWAGGFQWVPNHTGKCIHGLPFQYCAYCTKA